MAFERACREVDAHAPFGDHTLLTLQGQRQVRHARLTVHHEEALLGCAVLAEGLEAWSIELATATSHRNLGIGGALLEAAQAHVASHGGGALRAWVHDIRPEVAALAPAAEVVRTLFVLRRSLRNLPPVGQVVTRSLRDEERDAWLRLSNAAFVGHPDNGNWTRHDLDWRMNSPWTDLARWPVVVDHDRVLAGVWTKVEPGSSRGELYVVAVDPAAQGRGLGRAVVAQALHELARAGCDSALLYVEASNVRALKLYRSSGFTDGEIHRCLELMVSPALVANP